MKGLTIKLKPGETRELSDGKIVTNRTDHNIEITIFDPNYLNLKKESRNDKSKK